MRKTIALVIALIGALTTFAGPTVASSAQPVSMTLAEPLLQDCSVAIGFCGSGEVIPLGHATETLDLVAGTRTLILANGSIVLAEELTDLACPGKCFSQSHRIPPVSGQLTDTVIGGSGAYAGASGTLTGSVQAAGLVHVVMLSGSLHLP